MQDQEKVTCREDSVVKIRKRITEKIKDYDDYSFSNIQDTSLKTFFDLAQEFENQHDLYTISVLIPKIFFKYECILYLADSDGGLKIACRSDDIYDNSPPLDRDIPVFYKEPTLKENSFFIPIKGDIAKSYDVPYDSESGVFGIFEVSGAPDLSNNMKFFFEKYVNRIGFQLQNRMISEKNREHLTFIKSLVNDIGHNVIVPNMFFKLFFKRMKGKIDRAGAIGRELKEKTRSLNNDCPKSTTDEIKRLCKELNYIDDSMNEQFQQILSHYEQTSLFLETLLRRSHFEQGRYVLVPKRININEKIIKPQLDRYLPRLRERNIKVYNKVADNPNKEITVVADVGLISQAYANLFSNAVKYTRRVFNEQGNPEKYVAFEMVILKNFFENGKNGVKLSMFSTGVPISDEDVEGLFQEGYRGKNIEGEYGTGHGLQFIKEVVEMHNGVVGYESAGNGNNFYFILPA